jgi:hypothetical protein
MAVKLETLKARSERPELHEQAMVETVELLDGKALARAVVTRTLPSGQTIAHRQTFFYVQTPKGWRRTAPVATFLGEIQSLDTTHLHFVFHKGDRAAVEQLAPEAEALYVALRRATGQTLTAADKRLTVEVTLERTVSGQESVSGYLRLPSPLLFDLSDGYSAEELLALEMRRTLVERMLDTSLRRSPIRSQWRPVANGLHSWLMRSTALPLATGSKICAACVTQADSPGSWRMSDLLGCAGYPTGNSWPADAIYRPDLLYQQERLAAAERSLIDFIVATYGLDVLPALLHGFSRYDDWESMTPAVLGVSAAELESGWRGEAVARLPEAGIEP